MIVRSKLAEVNPARIVALVGTVTRSGLPEVIFTARSLLTAVGILTDPVTVPPSVTSAGTVTVRLVEER